MGPSNFAKVDLTKEECDAIYEACEALQAHILRAGAVYTVSRVAALNAATSSVKMKMSVASSLLKPTLVLSH